MKPANFFVFLLFISLLVAPFASAGAGIFLPSAEARTFYFEPEKSYEWTWKVHRASSLDVYLGGDLEEYGTLYDNDPNGGPRDVTFTLDLPAELEPGHHELMLFVEEARPEGVQVGGVARVGGRITIISLFASPYLEAQFKVPDVAEGGNTTAEFDLTSWSEVTTNTYADITLINPSGEVVLETQTDLFSLASKEQKKFQQEIKTFELEPGTYTARADFVGAQENLSLTTEFKVGTFDIELQSYTKEIYIGEANRFTVRMASRWNEQITNVRGRVELLNESETTASVDLPPFGSEESSTFIDLRDVTYEGLVNATISVLYESGGVREFPATVNVTQRPEPKNETPGFVFELNQITGLYLILFLLIMVNVVLLLRKKK